MSCVGRLQGRTAWRLPARNGVQRIGGNYPNDTRGLDFVKWQSAPLDQLRVAAIAVSPNMRQWIGAAQLRTGSEEE